MFFRKHKLNLTQGKMSESILIHKCQCYITTFRIKKWRGLKRFVRHLNHRSLFIAHMRNIPICYYLDTYLSTPIYNYGYGYKYEYIYIHNTWAQKHTATSLQIFFVHFSFSLIIHSIRWIFSKYLSYDRYLSTINTKMSQIYSGFEELTM